MQLPRALRPPAAFDGDLGYLRAYLRQWVESPAWDANPAHDDESRAELTAPCIPPDGAQTEADKVMEQTTIPPRMCQNSRMKRLKELTIRITKDFSGAGYDTSQGPALARGETVTIPAPIARALIKEGVARRFYRQHKQNRT